VFASQRILNSFNPDVLFFTGGYVAIPMAVAALRKPSVLFVPDIEPALALKALARFADRIALTTSSSSTYFPNKTKLAVTGYPVRPGLSDWTKSDALEYFNFDPNIPTLTVTGGSKGARSINNALINILPKLLEDMQIIHLTGHLDWEILQEKINHLPAETTNRYQAFPYLHEVGAALAAADLIVSRAGASILGEYPLFGVPAILVPYPHAWQYQKVNAGYLAERGAAVLLRDEDLETDLYHQIQSLISDPEALSRMSQAMAALAVVDADKQIARIISEMAGSPDGGITA